MSCPWKLFSLASYTIFIFVSAHKFQENLLRCMLQIENTFFELGESCEQDCLIICDRGAMDAAACNII